MTRRTAINISTWLLPCLAAAVSSWGFAKFGNLAPVAVDLEALRALASAAASLGATMLGFMLAALAVLASINHLQLVSAMRRTGHYKDLLATLFLGCVFMLLCLVGGLLLLFGQHATAAWVSVLAGLHVGALVSTVDIGRKFWLVLANINPT